MATTLYHYRLTTPQRTPLDLRAPLRAALAAVMHAARFVNATTELDGETAAQRHRRRRAYEEATASVTHERQHYIA